MAKMRWDHVRRGEIDVVQQKGGAQLTIPLHRDLAAILDLEERRAGGPIVRNAWGTRYTKESMGNWMAWTIEQARLPELCVTHGLRKAAARRLAEAGCTAHEIMSITGHKTLKEVERYTKAADQKRLARRAIERVSGPNETAL